MMCIGLGQHTEGRERSEKMFTGRVFHRGGVFRHTTPIPYLYLSFVLSVTSLLFYAKLRSVTLCFLIRIVTESTKDTVTSGNPGLTVCLVCLGHFGAFKFDWGECSLPY